MSVSSPTPSFQPVGFYDETHGMSQANPPHLVTEKCWWNTFNAQFVLGDITQTPPDLQLFELQETGSHSTGYTAIAVLVGNDLASTLLALSTGTNSVIIDFSDNNASPQSIGTIANTDTSGDFRIDWVTSSGVVYFCSTPTGLYQYPGVASPPDCEFAITSGTNYFPRYCEIYAGHLVIANLVDGSNKYPLRVAWSDKDDFRTFDPLTTNEADFFELDDNAQNALYGYGITGCRKLGDLLCVHTPGSIWNVRYVGFEAGVMDITQRVNGIGCWLPHALIAFDQYHIFPSRDDFYVYDGATLQPIGQDIKRFFFSDLSKDPIIRQRTWSDVDIERQELRWYYPSTESSGECDKCLVLNWPNRYWYVETGFGRTCAIHAGVNRTLRTIDGLAKLETQIDDLVNVASTIDGLALSSLLGFSFYGKGTDNFIYRNLTTDDYLTPGSPEDTRIITYPQMSLETRDFDFSDILNVKDIDTFQLEAEVNPKTLVSGTFTTQTRILFSIVGLTLTEANPGEPYFNAPDDETLNASDSAQITITLAPWSSGELSQQITVGTASFDNGGADAFTVEHVNTDDFNAQFSGTVSGLNAVSRSDTSVTFTITYLPNQNTNQYRWDLYVSVREKLTDAVNYEFMGSYFAGLMPDRLTQPRFAGKKVRFRLNSVNLVNSKFIGYAPILYAGTSEK